MKVKTGSKPTWDEKLKWNKIELKMKIGLKGTEMLIWMWEKKIFLCIGFLSLIKVETKPCF